MPCRMSKLWAFPSIKVVFLKGLSLKSSFHWVYGGKKPARLESGRLHAVGGTQKSHREGGFLGSRVVRLFCFSISSVAN